MKICNRCIDSVVKITTFEILNGIKKNTHYWNQKEREHVMHVLNVRTISFSLLNKFCVYKSKCMGEISANQKYSHDSIRENFVVTKVTESKVYYKYANDYEVDIPLSIFKICVCDSTFKLIV